MTLKHLMGASLLILGTVATTNFAVASSESVEGDASTAVTPASPIAPAEQNEAVAKGTPVVVAAPEEAIVPSEETPAAPTTPVLETSGDIVTDETPVVVVAPEETIAPSEEAPAAPTTPVQETTGDVVNEGTPVVAVTSEETPVLPTEEETPAIPSTVEQVSEEERVVETVVDFFTEGSLKAESVLNESFGDQEPVSPIITVGDGQHKVDEKQEDLESVSSDSTAPVIHGAVSEWIIAVENAISKGEVLSSLVGGINAKLKEALEAFKELL
jgi:hypothetical protein